MNSPGSSSEEDSNSFFHPQLSLRMKYGKNVKANEFEQLTGPTKFYAVACGRVPGIYRSNLEAQKQTLGFPNACLRLFRTEEQAQAFLDNYVKENKKEKLPNTFYAVAVGRKPGIYHTHEESLKQTFGYHNAKAKLFKTEIEALEFIQKYSLPKSASIRVLPLPSSAVTNSKSGPNQNEPSKEFEVDVGGDLPGQGAAANSISKTTTTTADITPQDNLYGEMKEMVPLDLLKMGLLSKEDLEGVIDEDDGLFDGRHEGSQHSEQQPILPSTGSADNSSIIGTAFSDGSQQQHSRCSTDRITSPTISSSSTASTINYDHRVIPTFNNSNSFSSSSSTTGNEVSNAIKDGSRGRKRHHLPDPVVEDIANLENAESDHLYKSRKESKDDSIHPQATISSTIEENHQQDDEDTHKRKKVLQEKPKKNADVTEEERSMIAATTKLLNIHQQKESSEDIIYLDCLGSSLASTPSSGEGPFASATTVGPPNPPLIPTIKNRVDEIHAFCSSYCGFVDDKDQKYLAAIGIYFGENHPRNVSFRIPSTMAQNQRRGDFFAILAALEIGDAIMQEQKEGKDDCISTYRIIVDSNFVFDSLTKWIWGWEKHEWRDRHGRDIEDKQILKEILDLMSARGKKLLKFSNALDFPKDNPIFVNSLEAKKLAMKFIQSHEPIGNHQLSW